MTIRCTFVTNVSRLQMMAKNSTFNLSHHIYHLSMFVSPYEMWLKDYIANRNSFIVQCV